MTTHFQSKKYWCTTCGGRGWWQHAKLFGTGWEEKKLPCDCGDGLTAEGRRALKWDRRFLEMARLVSTWSRDPSTKCGAVLVRPDKTIASVGFNGFASGMLDDAKMYDDREVKYSRVVHCEMNAVMFCRDPLPLTGFSLYTTGPSCDRCAVHMVQAGIRRFIWARSTREQHERWHVDKTLEYLKEVDAEILEITYEQS